MGRKGKNRDKTPPKLSLEELRRLMLPPGGVFPTEYGSVATSSGGRSKALAATATTTRSASVDRQDAEAEKQLSSPCKNKERNQGNKENQATTCADSPERTGEEVSGILQSVCCEPSEYAGGQAAGAAVGGRKRVRDEEEGAAVAREGKGKRARAEGQLALGRASTSTVGVSALLGRLGKK
ncbi:hypothetical protein GLOTRDRAFT_91448 [Gloeophyllum trabeum ATCC 11539]|uniref:Uncharacterized protein n=1 Tax=Gloeophyllum trabeum (strain ATCC 11539 / FP-39264 / Madison 617) TaxID=670483 RepID=S7QEW4_GLOTA|nr:uncharacterized protein GLOTRDRAFT_91448 [Gloeophyllum trabeum ATCC 11539]EPQ57848.1 hypothetical protein GLOTRDRAFT_91448 [Gloeophyllum trabeum ATCC 11539]